MEQKVDIYLVKLNIYGYEKYLYQGQNFQKIKNKFGIGYVLV